MRFKALVIVPHRDDIEIKQLVQCRECKHGHKLEKGNYYFCDNQPRIENDVLMSAYWYCADGEKGEEDARHGEGYQRT